mgnify:CR=1 FL=1
MCNANKILLYSILGLTIGLCGIVGGDLLLPEMVAHAADSSDGSVLPFPPTPSVGNRDRQFILDADSHLM